MTTFTSHSELESFNWAVEFSKQLKPGDTIAFFGNLGAGKTATIRGICKGLGFNGTVCSPTYTIVHEYPNNPPIYHLDLYRLDGGCDLEEAGLDRFLDSDGITLIEWSERLENGIGITHTVNIEIVNETERTITVLQKSPEQPELPELQQ